MKTLLHSCESKKQLKKGLFFFAIVFALLTTVQISYSQNGVLIAPTTGTADASAMLEVRSTLGFLAPRMLGADRLAIASPATGLLVFQTDIPAGFWYFDGTAWVQLSTAAGSVTSITAGNGLSGGTITSSGTIAIASGGVTNAMLANQSLTVTAGSGLSGGGTVALGGTTTLNNTGVLSVGGTDPIISSGGQNPTISHNTSGVAAGSYSNSNITVDAFGHVTAASNGSGTVGGSGTLNYISKWTPDGYTLGNSLIFDDGTNIGIGTASPSAQLHTTGTVRFQNYTNGILTVDGNGNLGVNTGGGLFTAGTGLSWNSTTLNSVWTNAGNYLNPSGSIGTNLKVANVQNYSNGFYADMNTGASSGYGATFMSTSSGGTSGGIYASGEYTGSGSGGDVYGGQFQSNSSTEDQYGIWSYANHTGTSGFLYGIYSYANTANNSQPNYGIYSRAIGGSVAYGIYATASGGGTNWAGYFNGDLNFTGSLFANGSAGTTGQVLTSQGTGAAPQWAAAAPDATAWHVTGNAGINPSINFMGTTDDHDVVFKRNNILAGLLNSASSNTSWGVGALNSTTVAPANTAIGYQALNSLTNGSFNTAGGYVALFSNTLGNYNTAYGNGALYDNIKGCNNTAIGSGALYNNTNAKFNTAIGNGALSLQSYDNGGTTWNTFNVAIGTSALGVNNPTNSSNGMQNVAIGDYSLAANSTGKNNTANGFEALYTNSTGNYNTANGSQALYSNTTAFYNTANGYQSLYSNTTGAWNTALGYQSLYNNGIGGNNTSVGNTALYSNTQGNNNTAYGNSALYYNTLGCNNTAIGNIALFLNTTAQFNTAIGNSALYTQSYNNGGTPWNTYNVAIGTNALYYNNPSSTANGMQNVAIGDFSLAGNSIGSNNTADGYHALYSNSTGGGNTVLGANSGQTITTGSNNTIIGSGADVGTNSLTNATAIGANASVSTSNTLVLGDNGSVSGTPVTATEFSGALMPYYASAYNAGTTGQVLVSQGAGAAPQWTTGGLLTGGTTGYNAYWTGANTLGAEQYVPILQGGTGLGTSPTNGQLLIGNGTNYTLATLSAGTGISVTNGSGSISIANTGVTSVALSLPSIFTVSGSPITTTGTLSGTLATETANTVFAGPTSGGAVAPTFRALVAADLPTGSGNYIQNQTASDQAAGFRITGNGLFNGGSVGIGTTSPSSQLTIVSPGNTTAAYFTVLPQNLTQSVNIGYNHIWEAGSNSNNAMQIDAQGTGYLELQANGGTGNVGIGTTTPSYKLYVTDGTNYAGISSSGYGINAFGNTYGGSFSSTNAAGLCEGLNSSATYTGSANPSYTYGANIYSSSTTQDQYGIYNNAYHSGTASGFLYGIYNNASTSNTVGTNYGIYSYASGGATPYGIYASAYGTGTTTYGVYGTASGAGTNWAGYFVGNGYFSGNVGIGTTTPNMGLVDVTALGATYAQFGALQPVYIVANSPMIGFNALWNGGYTYGSTNYAGILSFNQEVTGGWSFNTAPSGTGGAAATMTSRLAITNTGNVGIGTTTPAFKLQVPSGYIGTDYFNSTDNSVASGVTGMMVKCGDNYFRTATSAAVATFLGTSLAGNYIQNQNSGAQSANYWISGYGEAGSTNVATIGNHPTYGASYAAFWRNGSDYTILSDANNTFVNAPTTSGNIYLRAANSDRVFIQGTGTGYVGIGTTSPSTKVEIDSYNDPENSNATPLGAFCIKTTASTAMVMGVSNSSPYEGWIQVRHGTVAANTYPLCLRPMGNNVGIGTISPRGQLEVGNTTANQTVYIGGIYRGTGSGFSGTGQETDRHQIVFSSWRDAQPNTIGAKIVAINKTAYVSPNWDLVQNTDLAFFTLGTTPSTTDNTSEVMRITSTGNVGIGTTTPAYKLDVNGALNCTDLRGQVSNGANTLGTVPTPTGTWTAIQTVTITKELASTPVIVEAHVAGVTNSGNYAGLFKISRTTGTAADVAWTYAGAYGNPNRCGAAMFYYDNVPEGAGTVTYVLYYDAGNSSATTSSLVVYELKQ